ncbi:MAG: YeeE/YedE family protein [Rhizobiaceae bacterium]
MDVNGFLLPFSGLMAGTLLGYFARRNFFCTLSSLEQYWFANNSTGVRSWVLATALALAFTQILSGLGVVDVSRSFYLTPTFGWLGAIVGGFCFGVGMALVGTCGFGALVRLGSGSLKSLIAVLIIGLTALSTQRGLLGNLRVGFFDRFILDLTFANSQSIPSLIESVTGIDFTIAITVVLVSGALWWVFSDKEFRQRTSLIITAAVIAFVVTFGWLVTSNVARTSFDPVQIESASFVMPLGDIILQFAAFTGAGPDYGIGLMFGTIIGAAIAARSTDDIRWEACDDARELSRHILGAILMGFGGVLALGCTIGQGISAASLLAASVPVSMISIVFGARLGLAWLVEGSVMHAFRR